MKKAHTILSHLSSLPQFKVLKQQKCYQKYINLLSPKWQKAIAFVYIKNNTLFLVLNHPGFKMELNYNRDLLKSLLIQLNTYDKSCENMRADKIEIFHSKYYEMPDKKTSNATIPYYLEQSSGSFTLPQDDVLAESFARIQELIICKR